MSAHIICMINVPAVDVVNKDVAIGAGGLDFDSWAGQIGKCLPTEHDFFLI